ncbi:MAG: VOC family protein [Microthrixaceae bacterium]
MTTAYSYAPGTPSWVDVESPDTSKSAKFYEALFGWKRLSLAAPEQNSYLMMTLNDRIVAGLGARTMTAERPVAWSVYVTVADVDVAVAKCLNLGGSIVVEAADVMQAGRSAVVDDPLGTMISLWQPKDRDGVELVNEPGAFTWSELASTDLEASARFYTGLFGWGIHESTEHHRAFTVDGKVVCGAHTAAAGEASGWLVWFDVEDCDEVAVRAETLGGRVIVDPGDLDFGRGAVIADTMGAAFGIGEVRIDILESTA